MNKRIIVIVLIGILVIALGSLLFSKKGSYKNEPPITGVISTTPPPGEVTIHVTSTGFKPVDTELSPGTTVRWVKDINARVSIVSGDNPANPELNLGEIGTHPLTHVFTKEGVYNYYDKFNPSFKGKINVEYDR